MTIHPNRWSNLGQLAGTIAATLGFTLLAVFGSSNGPVGHIAAHIFGVLAMVSLLCVVQSLVWAVRKLPTFDFGFGSVTVYLMGWHPIPIQDHEIAQVVIRSTAQMIIALQLVSPQRLRKQLPFLDRCYFDYSQKFVGSGLSYNVSLTSKDLAEFLDMLRTRFDERLVYA
jgi:hypothetical protein